LKSFIDIIALNTIATGVVMAINQFESRVELTQEQLKGLFDKARPLGHQAPIKLRNGIQLTPSRINCSHCDAPTPMARLRAQIVNDDTKTVTRCFMFSCCDRCGLYFASAEAYVAKPFSAQLCMLIGDEWIPYYETKLSFMGCVQRVQNALLSTVKNIVLRASN